MVPSRINVDPSDEQSDHRTLLLEGQALPATLHICEVLGQGVVRGQLGQGLPGLLESLIDRPSGDKEFRPADPPVAKIRSQVSQHPLVLFKPGRKGGLITVASSTAHLPEIGPFGCTEDQSSDVGL